MPSRSNVRGDRQPEVLRQLPLVQRLQLFCTQCHPPIRLRASGSRPGKPQVERREAAGKPRSSAGRLPTPGRLPAPCEPKTRSSTGFRTVSMVATQGNVIPRPDAAPTLSMSDRPCLRDDDSGMRHRAPPTVRSSRTRKDHTLRKHVPPLDPHGAAASDDTLGPVDQPTCHPPSPRVRPSTRRAASAASTQT